MNEYSYLSTETSKLIFMDFVVVRLGGMIVQPDLSAEWVFYSGQGFGEKS